LYVVTKGPFSFPNKVHFVRNRTSVCILLSPVLFIVKLWAHECLGIFTMHAICKHVLSNSTEHCFEMCQILLWHKSDVTSKSSEHYAMYCREMIAECRYCM